jgi:hypothetical protein
MTGQLALAVSVQSGARGLQRVSLRALDNRQHDAKLGEPGLRCFHGSLLGANIPLRHRPLNDQRLAQRDGRRQMQVFGLRYGRPQLRAAHP